MFKRVAALLIGFLLIISMMLPVFANSSDDAFEVMQPSFGKNNEVIVEKNMLIYINLYEDLPLEMTLVRIEPNITDAVTRDKISSLEDNAAHMMPILESEEIEKIDLSDVSIDFELKDGYEEGERRDIAQAYLDTLIEKQSAEEEFIRAYNRYTEQFSYGEVDAVVPPVDLSYYEQEVVKEYERALEKMLKLNQEYELIREVYDHIFETVILGPEALTAEGPISVYRTVIENIKPGDYKLIFSEDGDVIDVKEFTVKKLEEAKIKESTTEILSNVINESTK
ncbi:MAG: hypothetical protein JXO44_08045 [Clostridia bacterium]|nr:hypothetical protein [Clostridia bacterium]